MDRCLDMFVWTFCGTNMCQPQRVLFTISPTNLCNVARSTTMGGGSVTVMTVCGTVVRCVVANVVVLKVVVLW